MEGTLARLRADTDKLEDQYMEVYIQTKKD